MAVVNFLNFIEGLYTDVPPHLVPPNALYLMDNVNTSYKMGAILKRNGYDQVGSPLEAGNSILGLHNFRQTSAIQKMLATVDDATNDDTQLFYSTGGAWTEVGAAETAWADKAGINVEMEDFIEHCFMVGYGATDGFISPGTLTGTTFSSTANIGGNTGVFTAATTDIITDSSHGLLNGNEITVASAGTLPAGLAAATSYFVIVIDANSFYLSTTIGGTNVDITDTGSGTHTWTKTVMPNGKFIKRYRDRLYVANTDIGGTATPTRVYFSNVPVGGAITWDQTFNTLDVDYSEEITGLGANWDRLVIFTEYSAYFYDQTQFKKVWEVGCSSNRTIKNSGGYMIWVDRDGVWMSTGGRPENVAGRVIDFIRFTDMTNAFAEVVDEEYHLHIGSVVVNGVSYGNCSLILNIPTMTWRVAEYSDTFTIFSKFYSSGQDRVWMGDNSGEVMKLGKYTDSTLVNSDDGKDIFSWFQTGAMSLDAPAVQKKLNKIWAYADRAQGLKLKARVVDNNTLAVTEFKKLGELKKYINEYQIRPDYGNFIQIEGVETGQLPYWSMFGYSVDFSIDKPATK